MVLQHLRLKMTSKTLILLIYLILKNTNCLTFLKYQKKVMDFDCTDEFLKLSPIEITQELRGGLFYFIESLVPQSQSSSSYNEKNVLRIMCFFALCVKMIAIFLQKILQHQKEVLKKLIILLD